MVYRKMDSIYVQYAGLMSIYLYIYENKNSRPNPNNDQWSRAI